jgi:ATP-dependent Lhr-like helicase
MDGAVDRLRAIGNARDREEGRHGKARTVVLAAADPANAYGAALPWPEQPAGVTHRPGRKAGALVVLVDGELTLYVERGGKTLLAWPGAAGSDGEGTSEGTGEGTVGGRNEERLRAAADALALTVRDGALGRLTVERTNGESALTSGLGRALEAAGFHATPRGLRLRA